jgi:hypothetical protein
MAEKCIAIARSGKSCQSAVVAGSQYCYVHDPALAEARREAARKGGRNRSNRARASKRIRAYGPHDVAVILSACLKDLIAGDLDIGTATAAASLGRACLAAAEKGQIETLLQELEAAHEQRNKEGLT